MIKQKRDSLEKFIREQLIGPGGCNGRFDVSPSNDNDAAAVCEVVNTTPGSIYSTAMLFPKKGQDLSDNEAADEEDANLVDEDANHDDDEDINSLARRFPNMMGVSCCFPDLDSMLADTKITISGRHYKRIADVTRIRVNIHDTEFFEKTLESEECHDLFAPFFAYASAQLSLIQARPRVNDVEDLRNNMRRLNTSLCEKVANVHKDTTVFPAMTMANKLLAYYKSELFKRLKKVQPDGAYLSPADVTLYKDIIADIERYETFLSYFDDLLAAYSSNDFGFWEGRAFSQEIDLATLKSHIDAAKNKIVISPIDGVTKRLVKIPVSDDVEASLSVWLQIYRGKDGRSYLKVMVENDSTPVRLAANRYYSIVTEVVNRCTFFGVTINVASKNIVPYRAEADEMDNDPEANSLNYLYRSIADYGVGHLCSVDWRKEGDGTVHVHSEFLPAVETPDVEPEPRDKTQIEYNEKTGEYLPKKFLTNNQCLQFKWLSVLSNATDAQIVDGLRGFAGAYKQWIDALDAQGNPYGQENIAKCRQDYERIRSNIDEFLTNQSKMLLFRLMNTAMFIQLWHSKARNQQQALHDEKELTIDYYRDNALDTTIFPGVHAAWRPFQLAFILLNLDGVFQSQNDPSWAKRNELVDLVWFPTGGGKTESYLGIIALVALTRRRMFGQHGGGVAAIMRYTLRLLTTQQFQRAMRLILALEQMRRWDGNPYGLGDEPFSIGLYVGEASLPNTFTALQEEINKANAGQANKIPLDRCPWCGSKIIMDGTVNNAPKFYCENDECTFNDLAPYPVRLCDEHVYSAPPTLLFGTVDKFAQIARKVNTADGAKDSRRLFGVTAGFNPPDLIIQDELHLLLGPLGSAVALFESAIDQLCSRTTQDGQVIRPKIISSTATTRNTALQVRALYDRGVSIFPKSGTDYDDSFFAFYKRHKYTVDGDWQFISKRKYVGIMPTGRTQMTTQMRLAAILFVHRAMFELEHKAKLAAGDPAFIQAADYYYSIISYFNSLKEVGKTDAQFYMEFTKYTRRLFKRVLRFSDMLECFYAFAEGFKKSELTGRLTGSEAVKALEDAQSVTWLPERRLPYCPDPANPGVYTYAKLPDDYILATNMISVGLDVSRFNTIIMNSMPRNIAEYIQASSRVAREKEGLVLTLHNPFRSRDVSHFERFKEFHEKLYYYVEPISITPFSPKAVDRYLPLYIASLIRHRLGYPDRTDARRLIAGNVANLKAELKKYFADRFARTSALHGREQELLTPEQLTYINQCIDATIDQWYKEIAAGNLVFTSYPRANNETELYVSPSAYSALKANNRWVVPMSVRIVEPESAIHIID